MKDRLNIKGFWKRLWMDFAPAALLCIVLTITLCLLEWQRYWQLFREENSCLSYCMSGAVSGLCLSVLGSLMRRQHRWPRWLDWLWAAAGCAVGVVLIANKWQPAYWGTCIAIVLLCVHIACGRENQSLRLGQIASCFFSSLGLAVGLLLALQLCFNAVSSLFFPGDWRIENDLMTLAATLSFLMAAPWLFLGRLPNDPTEGKNGFSKVTAYLFLPAYLLLLGILLCYILMILIRWEMPVGQMNGLALTALSLFAVFRLTLTGEENRLAGWFVRWGAWLLLPVIAVQQVGVWMRYAAYGLTAPRYAGMVITLLLVLVVAWACARKRADWFFVAAAVAALMLTVSPISAANVARWNQEIRLRNALIAYDMYDAETGRFTPNADVPKEQQQTIYSAAYYLRDLDNPPKRSFAYELQQQLTNEDGDVILVRELFGFETSERAIVKIYNVYGSNTDDSVEVSGFRHAQWYSYKYRFDETEQEDAPLVPVETLLACADFPTETLLTEDVRLADGRTLRICYLRLREENGAMDRLQIDGWLLTP